MPDQRNQPKSQRRPRVRPAWLDDGPAASNASAPAEPPASATEPTAATSTAVTASAPFAATASDATAVAAAIAVAPSSTATLDLVRLSSFVRPLRHKRPLRAFRV